MAGTTVPATGEAWSESVPDDGQPHGNDYNEHRETKMAMRIRMCKEHDAFAASSAGGEHKAGSAKIYVGDYSDAAAGDDLPTTRPDGSTALDSDDAGRLAFDTDATYGGILYKWSGSSWEAIDLTFTNIASSTIDEDDMASDSDVHVPTQQSVKAFVEDYAHTPSSATSKNKDTIYEAEAFGLLCIKFTLTWLYNTDRYVTVKSDESTPPTTVVSKAGGYPVHSANSGEVIHFSMLVPVLAGDYYLIEDTAGITALSINWYPFGN